MPDYEELLRGADRPRPLPPELRARLEEAVTGAVKPLPEVTRQRLEHQLRSRVGADASGPAGGQFTSEDQDAVEGQQAVEGQHAEVGQQAVEGQQPGIPARPGVAKPTIPWNWRARLAAAGVAAALVALAAIGGATLFHGGPRSPVVASRAATSSGGVQSGTLQSPAKSRKVAGPARPAPGVFAPRARGAAHAQSRPAVTASPGARGAANAAGRPLVTAAPRSSGAVSALARPVVTALNPRQGPSKGGNWVRLTGSSFSGATSVRFGRVLALRYVIVSPEQVRALAPAHSPGTVDVSVQGPAGRSEVSVADRYSFVR